MKPDEQSGDDPLAVLRRGVEDAPWHSPEQLRNVAGRRRKRRRLAGAATVAAATAITLVVVVPGSGGRSGVDDAGELHTADRAGAAVQLVANAHSIPPDSEAAKAVAQAEQAFTFALLHQVNKSGQGGNVVLSPSSLAIALSMLQNGAVGGTRQGIAKALQTTGLTTAQQNAGWATLMDDLADAGKQGGLTLESANSLWLQHDLPMRQPFMDALAQYFRTGVWQVDFAGNLPAAVDAINSWVTDKTHGKITRLFDDHDIDASTVLVLANAVYFKAAWQYQFDPQHTRNGDFHLAGGSTANVPFMTMTEDETGGAKIPFATTPDYDAVQLPYTGGRFAALAIMPKKQDLTSFVDGLTPARLSQITATLSGEHPFFLRMPRFTAEEYTNLNNVLSAMGMGQAFGGADFSAMSPAGLAVNNVVQRDYLSVDEKGTEAAAVSGIAVDLAAPFVVSLDHPFLFLIRDTTTGTVLFAAQVQNPKS